MQSDKKNNIVVVNKIHRKIIEVYPFLTKIEKDFFTKRSKIILEKFLIGQLKTDDAIRKLIHLLKNNGHADIKEHYKPNRKFLREVKIKKRPTFNIKNRVLFIIIPSWSILLGAIDKKLINFCKNNIEKYNALIIDVRENKGGSSRIAHSFASIFFKKSVEYGKFISRAQNSKLKVINGKLTPNKKFFIDKPIVILISKKCFSSSELFLAPFKVSKRATLIGESTGGGSANPISEIIKISRKNFEVRIPTHRFYLNGKNKPIEETKIKPDIFYRGKNVEKFAKDYLVRRGIL